MTDTNAGGLIGPVPVEALIRAGDYVLTARDLYDLDAVAREFGIDLDDDDA